ncbi:MAG: hypothetical protein WCF84_17560 [Anaerolineae bacterium]
MKSDIDAGVEPVAIPAPPAAVTPRKNQLRIAWLVMWSAFFVCLLLTVSLPLGARHLILYTLEPQPGMLQAISPNTEGCGTVRFTPPNATQPTAVTCDPAPFLEGSTIATDPSSRGFITFFDGSIAQVFPDSSLVATEMSQPRYQWSRLPNQIKIQQDQGLVIYAVAPGVTHAGNPDGRPVNLQVHTRSFDATLSEGSYSIEVTDTSAQIVVTRGGPATLQSADGVHSVLVEQGQRLLAATGQPLPDPVAAAQDLIADGNFSGDALSAAWLPWFDQGGDGGNIDGTVSLTTLDSRRALHILRQGAGTNSAIAGVRQQFNRRDVSMFSSLVFAADIRLHHQSLSGGGYQSTEYPLIIRLRYRDASNNDQEMVQGFYYQNDDGNPVRNGERIPQDKWVPFQTGNLLQGLASKPFTLLTIEVYASGWDYDSYISSLRLTAE